MIVDILKALLVGIIAAIPVGPVLIMAIQKTLCRGRGAGLMIGLGSAFADAVYAAIGLFALSLIEDFIVSNQAVIMIVGGVIVGLLGANMFFSDVKLQLDGQGKTVSDFSYAIQAVGSVFSNPAALATMLALLALFRLDSSSLDAPVWAVILCVSIGEFLYWLTVVTLLSTFVKFRESTLRLVSKIAGAGVAVFAIVLIIKGITML